MDTKHYFCLLRTFALATLTAAAVAACSDDTDTDREPLTPPDGIPVTFSANINPGSDAAPAATPGTRTILTPTPEGGFTVKWKGKDSPDGSYDRILIWAVKDNTLTSQSAITYVPTTSDVSSELVPRNDQNKLTVPSADDWTFTAIYGEYGSGNGIADAMVSPLTQSVPGDNKHIARYDFSIATATQYVAANNDMPNIGLQFKHMLSAMQLHVTNATGEALTVREIRLSAAGGQIANYRAYNVAAGDWKTTGERKSDYLQLKIQTPAALASNATEPQKFHMLLFPGYENKTLIITVITDRGEYTLTKGAPTGGFIAGKNYLTDITITSTPGTGETWTEYVGISTPQELAAFSSQVNDGTDNYAGKTVRLLNDITLTGTWTPIGTDGKPFSGTFDGGGYSISGLNVNTTENYAGLFGSIKDGTVRNLRVKGTVKTTGNYYAGGIVGYLDGSTVENCIFEGEVSGIYSVGGIAGSSLENCRIAGCHTKGSVTATGYAGGIAGDNVFSSCTITDCYSEAKVTTSNQMAGGIIGQNNDGTITRCYATGQVSGKNNVGGIVGQLYAGTVKGCIALNSGLTRTEGDKTTFGRIVGHKQQNSTVDNCAAFSGMTIKDATSNATITSGATSVAGDDLTAANCLAKTTYTTDRGFAEPTATTPGWAFDTATTWAYLPWNKAFENFHSLSPRDYRIEVPPAHHGRSHPLAAACALVI